MRRFFALPVMSLCLLGAGSLSAAPAGTGLFPAGYDPVPLSLGLCGVAEADAPSIGANPAAPGDLRQAALGFSGGLWSGLYSLEAVLSLPTESGVFSFGGRFLPEDSGRELARLVDIRFALSKPVAPGLLWGISLQGGHDLLSGDSDWYASLSLGLVSLPGPVSGEGFGWHRFRWGLVLRNLGKPALHPHADPLHGPLHGPQAVAGLAFDFFRVPGLAFALTAELGLSPWAPRLAPGIGLEARLFDRFSLRSGLAPLRENQGVLTLGAGLLLDSGEGRAPGMELNYAALMLGGERLHQFGIRWAFGARDRDAPRLDMRADQERISPNDDGVQDALSLTIGAEDGTAIVAWACEFRNAAGSLVARYSGTPPEPAGSGLSAALARIFSRLPSVTVPGTLVFNGLDMDGKTLPDGWYRYRLEATDRNGNSARQEGRVLIDTKTPHFQARPERDVFSPNGDGRFETLRFVLDGSGIEPGDRAVLQILDTVGRPVRTIRWLGRLPADWVWDGMTGEGTPAPEGRYRTLLEAGDRAGNIYRHENSPFRLIRRMERVTLRTVTPVFSPNGDGVLDNAVCEAAVSHHEGLEEWQLRITDASGKTVNEMKGGPPLPERLVFSGRTAAGKVLPDGFYQAVLSLVFDSGNQVSSARQFLEIDTTPVRLEASVDFQDFSPNGDGLQDEVTVTQRATGKASDLVRLAILDSQERVILNREWRLEAFPRSFVWNGLDSGGRPFPEGLYTYRLDAEDPVGNRSRFELPPLRLKTGLERVSLTVTPAAMAPGADDGRGTAEFTIKAGRPADIREQLVEVLDAAGRPVRSFRSATFQEKLVFDGRDDGGRILPDGSYTCRARIRYVFGDTPSSAAIGLLLDATPPALELDCPEPAFSPNGDGRLDQLTIRQQASGGPEDVWQAVIRDAAGLAVRTYAWTGKVPAELVWDGSDGEGRPLPEGEYRYQMGGRDRAGNSVEKSVAGIRLVRGFEKLTVQVAPPILSPAQTNVFLITATIDPPREPLSWRIEIRDGAKRVVRLLQGRGALPAEIPWDARDAAGRPVADGWYSGVLGCVFHHGNRVETPLADLLVDGSPPTVGISRIGDDFTPDGDGVDDSLRLVVVLRDLTAVTEWRIAILPDAPQAVRAAFVDRGAGNDQLVRRELAWDGRFPDGRPVGSLMPFRVLVEAVDLPGNQLRDRSFGFTSGLLLDRSGETPSVRIGAASPAFDRMAPAGLSPAALDRLTTYVRRVLADPGRFGMLPGTRAWVLFGAAGQEGLERSRQVLPALQAAFLKRGVPAARLAESALVPVAEPADEWLEIRFVPPGNPSPTGLGRPAGPADRVRPAAGQSMSGVRRQGRDTPAGGS